MKRTKDQNYSNIIGLTRITKVFLLQTFFCKKNVFCYYCLSNNNVLSLSF